MLCSARLYKLDGGCSFDVTCILPKAAGLHVCRAEWVHGVSSYWSDVLGTEGACGVCQNSEVEETGNRKPDTYSKMLATSIHSYS